MKPYRMLLLICIAAFILRILVLQFVQHPGVGDPNHYYNLGLRLIDGHGFTIDYIWQFNNPPDQLEHPDDYWMPLTGVLAALSMQIFGRGVHEALLVFVLIGSLIPVIGFVAAKQFGCSDAASLFAAAVSAFLPELVLNSVRTDTTIPNTLLVGMSILLLLDGLRKGRILSLIGSGVTAGLAYLIRSDSSLLIPMIVVLVVVYAVWGKAFVPARRLRYVALTPLVAFLVALPWILRNIQISGTPTTPKLEYMFYLTDYLDHYVYDTPLSLQTLLQKQTPAQLIGKRLFEMAASVKLMYTIPGEFLAVALAGGIILLIRARDSERWLFLAPTLILLLGFFVFYTILAPFKSQGGSFKKAYLTLIPLLIPIGAYALDRVLADNRVKIGVMLLAILFMALNAFEYVRADAASLNSYLDTMRKVASAALALPDTNQDNHIVLMAQDPFMLRFVGVQAVMIPMENRDTILKVAERYHVDYVMMPPARPALDPIYLGQETDPRLTDVLDVSGTYVKLYRINP